MLISCSCEEIKNIFSRSILLYTILCTAIRTTSTFFLFLVCVHTHLYRSWSWLPEVIRSWRVFGARPLSPSPPLYSMCRVCVEWTHYTYHPPPPRQTITRRGVDRCDEYLVRGPSREQWEGGREMVERLSRPTSFPPLNPTPQHMRTWPTALCDEECVVKSVWCRVCVRSVFSGQCCGSKYIAFGSGFRPILDPDLGPIWIRIRVQIRIRIRVQIRIQNYTINFERKIQNI